MLRRALGLALAVPLLAASGCMMIGPDYQRPRAPLAQAWIDRAEPAISRQAEPIGAWWESFDDPTLSDLIAQAYRQNPSLQAAGVRVLEAQARRGIAIGTLFPQGQALVGSYSRVLQSKNIAIPVPDRSFGDLVLGFDAAWELDIWGRFRRGIEAADADVLAAVASYDDVLVSLLAEVAANYVQIRTLQQELAVAQQNAQLQRNSYDIARVRYDEGAATALDPAQAATLLYDTEARIPAIEARIEGTASTLSVLLGVPPRRVQDLLGDAQRPIPSPATEVAVGIPADLLRRRPDVRRAERLLASQSARIGIAKSDLLPHLSLVGEIALNAESARDLFEGKSARGFGGPTFRWDILNYGRITNNVRVQDARYQALVGDYETTVLRAQADVESAMAAYLGAIRRTASLTESVVAAQKAVDVVSEQYREGAIDFTAVLLAQDFLVTQESTLATSRGEVALALVATYKALGGGWEPFEGRSVVGQDTAEQMRARTRWGALLGEREQAAGIEAASTGTESDRGWWRWRWWWPQW